jgi:predicted enzyme related to lactoylglutathione lyase
MIVAMHALVFADDPDRARAFFRDVLDYPAVDTGGGWLIFKTGPSELGVHPSDRPDQGFDVSLICDDLDETISELTARGAEFASEVTQERWGRRIQLKVPGAGEMTLYEPAYDPPAML